MGSEKWIGRVARINCIMDPYAPYMFRVSYLEVRWFVVCAALFLFVLVISAPRGMEDSEAADPAFARGPAKLDLVAPRDSDEEQLNH